MALAAGELRVGVIFTDGGYTYRVLRYDHIKRGRQPAVYKVKIKDLNSGAIMEQSYKDANKFDIPDVQRKSAQFMYKDNSDAYFMYNDTYEQFDVPVTDLEWEMNFLVDGVRVIVMLLEGKVVSLELDKKAELTVFQADPAVPGNTSSGATKKAIMETGYEAQVPLFINVGEKLLLNTDTGLYAGRVSTLNR